jgi:hypothetical protein
LNIVFINIKKSFTTLSIIDLGLLPYTRAYPSFAYTRVSAWYCEGVLCSEVCSLIESRIILLADTTRMGRSVPMLVAVL